MLICAQSVSVPTWRGAGTGARLGRHAELAEGVAPPAPERAVGANAARAVLADVQRRRPVGECPDLRRTAHLDDAGVRPRVAGGVAPPAPHRAWRARRRSCVLARRRRRASRWSAPTRAGRFGVGRALGVVLSQLPLGVVAPAPERVIGGDRADVVVAGGEHQRGGGLRQRRPACRGRRDRRGRAGRRRCSPSTRRRRCHARCRRHGSRPP